MTQELSFRRFTSPGDEGWSKAMEIYEGAFPRKERRSVEQTLKALEDPCFHADGVWCDGALAALFFYWDFEGEYYGEFLAVDPELRNRRLGERILGNYLAAHRMILEIEPPEEEMARRRKGFYERLGFVENPYHYIHPSFSKPFEPHRLVLMSHPRAIDEQTAVRFCAFVREKVMAYSEHELPVSQPRINPEM